MAKKFNCRDIGMDCSFSAKAANESDLMEKIKVHAKSAHNMQTIDAATMSKIKKAIKEA